MEIGGVKASREGDDKDLTIEKDFLDEKTVSKGDEVKEVDEGVKVSNSASVELAGFSTGVSQSQDVKMQGERGVSKNFEQKSTSTIPTGIPFVNIEVEVSKNSKGKTTTTVSTVTGISGKLFLGFEIAHKKGIKIEEK